VDGVIDPLGTDFQVNIKETLGKTCFRFFPWTRSSQVVGMQHGKGFQRSWPDEVKTEVQNKEVSKYKSDCI
jgi:hypothetical protein